MQKMRYESILRRLQNEGLRFSEFSVSTTGNYSRDDADWNYKDVPHLHHVHHLAEAYPLAIGDEIICNINMQRILGLWFPITLIIYEMGKYCQVYATTLLMFVLVVETKMEEKEPLKTTVTTRYNIGYPRWLFFAVPVLRWLVTRNYHVLMEADLPMRERRGALRKLGYDFRRKGETYGYLETTAIYDSNVVPPAASAGQEHTADYQSALGDLMRGHVGDEGLLGLTLTRAGDQVTVWPRTCPHEGAALDHKNCSEGKIRCPWHGREFTPIGSFTWGSDASFKSRDYEVSASGTTLRWQYLNS